MTRAWLISPSEYRPTRRSGPGRRKDTWFKVIRSGDSKIVLNDGQVKPQSNDATSNNSSPLAELRALPRASGGQPSAEAEQSERFGIDIALIVFGKQLVEN